MAHVHVRFDEVVMRSARSGKCMHCGKRTRRVVRVFQTINPWNKDPATQLPRTRAQVALAVREELQAKLKQQPLLCTLCEWREWQDRND